MNASPACFDLFEEGLRAVHKTGKGAGFREDGSVLLTLGLDPAQDPCELGNLERQPRTVHFHPLKGDSLDSVLARIAALKTEHPGCSLHGLSPGWVKRNGLAALERAQTAGLDSLAWFSGSLAGTDPAAQGWEDLARADIPKVACFTYAPTDSPDDLRRRIDSLAAARQLKTLAPLPASVGDVVMLSDLTTDGLQDVSVLVWSRLAAQSSCHVRASWAALGWKMAQSTLEFGSDELCGWGLEEFLAYSQRVRPATRIGREQVMAGIEEAGRVPVEVPFMRMGLLSYINTLPVTWGLESGVVPFEGEFVRAEPTRLNAQAAAGELDITPVSSIHYLYVAEEYRVVPGIALCSSGPVRSVKLFSRVPVDQLSGRWVGITNASATSRILLQLLIPGVLCEDLPETGGAGGSWKGGDAVPPLDKDGNYCSGVPELTEERPAVLLIGDQALLQAPVCEYTLDLGQAWYEQTGMPMVWALWIARQDVPIEDAVALLESSRRWGEHHPELVTNEALRRTELSRPQLEAYFGGLRNNFDDFELEGLRQFYLRASRLELVSSQLLSRVRLPQFSSL